MPTEQHDHSPKSELCGLLIDHWTYTAGTLYGVLDTLDDHQVMALEKAVKSYGDFRADMHAELPPTPVSLQGVL